MSASVQAITVLHYTPKLSLEESSTAVSQEANVLSTVAA